MSKTVADPLAAYWARRNFSLAPERRGERAKPSAELTFVIQKHAATRLHYDFRLELDGVLFAEQCHRARAMTPPKSAWQSVSRPCPFLWLVPGGRFPQSNVVRAT